MLTFFRRFCKKSKSPSGRNPKWPLPQQWICTQIEKCVAFKIHPPHPSPLPQWGRGGKGADVHEFQNFGSAQSTLKKRGNLLRGTGQMLFMGKT
ncbi:hypothetical protein EJA70_26940 [Pseudomonas sp. PB103]|nr:hypothetical protein EJA70_26940 [Pseudomonas sp. PB103]